MDDGEREGYHRLRARAASMHATAERIEAKAARLRGLGGEDKRHTRRALTFDHFARIHRLAAGQPEPDPAPADSAAL